MTEPCAQPSTELRELLEAVWRRIDRDELARLTQELVRIPSVYHPEEAEVPIVTVEVTGKTKTIVLPDGSQLITSPGLRATLTNLEDPDNQVSFGITGPIRLTELENGVLLAVGRGRNLLLDPGGGTFLTIGRVVFTLTPTAVPGVFDITILESTGPVIDVCALLE